MGAPGPSSFLAVLVGHIATGLVGFLVGTHSGPIPYFERDLDHLVEVAVEIATKRCGEVVERQLGPGGSEPPYPKTGTSPVVGDSPSNSGWWRSAFEILAGTAVVGWLILVVVILTYLCLKRADNRSFGNNVESPTSDVEKRELARRQLSEVRQRKHVTGK